MKSTIRAFRCVLHQADDPDVDELIDSVRLRHGHALRNYVIFYIFGGQLFYCELSQVAKHDWG